MALSRRALLRSGAAVALGWLGAGGRVARAAGTQARVVIVGGGFGGATCARYLRQLDPSVEVTLIEREPRYLSCPLSNLVLVGERTLDAQAHGYGGLRALGVRVLFDTVTEIDPVARRVRTAGGTQLDCDRLVLAPGIELRFDAIAGYDAAAAQQLPHAWHAGEQTLLLQRQLAAMPDNGVVLISVPAEPYRCPPGPYERASLIADWMRTQRPRGKLLILDTKDSFTKQALFQSAWQTLYPGLIEWVRGSDGGAVERVDAAARTLYPGFGFNEHRGDVVNVIPPQRAGAIAQRADLSDASGWCPVDQLSFESLRHAGVYVIGDAAIAGKMPKSAFSANSQAKVCAAALLCALHGQALPEPSYANTCYSLVARHYGISVSAVYRLQQGHIEPVAGAGGTSPLEAPSAVRAQEAAYAEGWYASIMADSFG